MAKPLEARNTTLGRVNWTLEERGVYRTLFSVWSQSTQLNVEPLTGALSLAKSPRPLETSPPRSR
jgi:hypothetical protein